MRPQAPGPAADEADLKEARELELKINRRLYKIERDNDQILKLQMRIQRYRQEISRLSIKRSAALTFRLL